MKIRIQILIGMGMLWAFSAASLCSQVPDWVQFYAQGRMSEISGTEYYVGVGESKDSFDDSDQQARIRFAQNVETRVESSLEEVYREEAGEESSSLEMTLDVKTDLSLKGISVSEQYRDADVGVFYSLIRINRQDYLAILEQNLKEEVILKMADLERQTLEMEQQRLEQEKELEALRLEEQRKELMKARYGDYLERQPYPALISFENAEVYHGSQHLTASLILNEELALRRLGYAITFAELFQLGTNHITDFSRENNLVYSDLDVKITLMKNKGSAIGFSAAIGARGYVQDPIKGDNEPEGTLYGAVDLSVPQLFYTDYSLYAGLDRVAGAVAWYPLYSFDFFKDTLGILVEGVYDFRDDLHYGATEKNLRVQTALQFKPAEQVCTRISWEDNFQTVVLSMDLNF